MSKGLTKGKLQEVYDRVFKEPEPDEILIPVEKAPRMAGLLCAFEGEEVDWAEVDRLEAGTKQHGLEWLKKECADE